MLNKCTYLYNDVTLFAFSNVVLFSSYVAPVETIQQLNKMQAFYNKYRYN